MSPQQTGAQTGDAQPGAATAPMAQAEASQTFRAPGASGLAAFGTGGGAAILFRDLASI